MIGNYDRILNVAQLFLTMSGVNPTKGIFLMPSIILSNVFIYGLGINTLWGLLFECTSFGHTLDLLLSFMAIITTLSRLATMMIKKKQVQELVEDMEKFWDVQLQEYPNESEVHDILTVWSFLLTFFRNYSLVLIVVCNILAVLTKNLIFATFIPDLMPQYAFSLLNAISFDYIVFSSIGCDMYFCAILILLRVQFKILNNRLKSLDYSLRDNDRNYHNHIRRCVIHHNFLYRFLNKINNTFGLAILVHFQGSLLTICMVLFGFSMTEDNLGRKVEYLLFLGGGFVELLIFYCLPGECLHSEISDTANSIYQSNFYECSDMKTKKSLLLMMIRATKETKVYAGKVMVLNLATYATICKTAFSFFTALQNINQNKQEYVAE